MPAIEVSSSREVRVMLILKRKIDESIVLTSPHISGEIVIKFIRNNYEGLERAAPTASITIGITAPSDVLILRSELISKPDDTHETELEYWRE